MIALLKAVLTAISIGSLIAKYAPWLRGVFVVAGGSLGPFAVPVLGLGKALWGSFWAVVNNPFTALALILAGFGLGFVQGDKWRYRQVAAIYAELEATNERLAAYEARDEAEAAAAKAGREETGKAVRVELAGFTCPVPAGLGAVISRAGR